MRTLQHDLENNFRAILQSGLARLELTTRTEFELQSRVLERTRARLEQLELRVATLEQRLKEFEESLPPVSD
jgi:BMFP domain-containing protein YqiC